MLDAEIKSHTSHYARNDIASRPSRYEYKFQPGFTSSIHLRAEIKIYCGVCIIESGVPEIIESASVYN